MKSVPCDPRNPDCQRTISDDWELKHQKEDEESVKQYNIPESLALSAYKPNLTWRRSWRERHSLNFFVQFTVPQMAGFFDSTFWYRIVIQSSYHEAAIMHATIAIGAMHEAIMQRSYTDKRRKGQAMEFALNQCNLAISSLTNARSSSARGRISDSKLALITCVLFTCFEAMQGRCDSAVSHALQGRKLLQAMGNPDQGTKTAFEESDIEQMRPLVERLEIQALALLDKGKRTDPLMTDRFTPLPDVAFIFTLDHAHNALHMGLNSIMRFMQTLVSTPTKEEAALNMAEKHTRYASWFQQWELAFSTFITSNRATMSDTDLKRAMVLKANHLVGTMLASVDQSAGPIAYDPYENEFKAIVDLSREVLATFSAPPLPTLSRGPGAAPYLSFSLWVTDPLWMAISRCRNPGIRQAAFTLLSQNPRQEGIWHAGPRMANNRYMTKGQEANGAKEKTAGGKKVG